MTSKRLRLSVTEKRWNPASLVMLCQYAMVREIKENRGEMHDWPLYFHLLDEETLQWPVLVELTQGMQVALVGKEIEFWLRADDLLRPRRISQVDIVTHNLHGRTLQFDPDALIWKNWQYEGNLKHGLCWHYEYNNGIKNPLRVGRYDRGRRVGWHSIWDVQLSEDSGDDLDVWWLRRRKLYVKHGYKLSEFIYSHGQLVQSVHGVVSTMRTPHIHVQRCHHFHVVQLRDLRVPMVNKGIYHEDHRQRSEEHIKINGKLHGHRIKWNRAGEVIEKTLWFHGTLLATFTRGEDEHLLPPEQLRLMHQMGIFKDMNRTIRLFKKISKIKKSNDT